MQLLGEPCILLLNTREKLMTPLQSISVQLPAGRPLEAAAQRAVEPPTQQPPTLPVQPRPAGAQPSAIAGQAGTIDLRA